eukprot:6135689-Karenia_brevis.AAC.1
MIANLEKAGASMKASGKSQRWFEGSDSELAKAVAGVNGKLFQTLLLATGYKDAQCVELFRTGTCCITCHTSAIYFVVSGA